MTDPTPREAAIARRAAEEWLKPLLSLSTGRTSLYEDQVDQLAQIIAQALAESRPSGQGFESAWQSFLDLHSHTDADLSGHKATAAIFYGLAIRDAALAGQASAEPPEVRAALEDLVYAVRQEWWHEAEEALAALDKAREDGR
jgi:hypothetical protein